MLSIKQKEKCCGCSACAAVCPKKCITMISDEEGFLYPDVNKNECISCNKCVNICPVDKYKDLNHKPVAVIAQNLDSKKRINSSSGGAFTAIAEHVVECGGVVFGAAFDSNYKVIHTCVNRAEDLHIFRGSKYVQSEIGDSYEVCKVRLDEGKLVCFSGTPCQVTGLKSFLGKDYSNLICVDLVCHGVPSPKLFEMYKEFCIQKYGDNFKYIKFRDKSYGYAGSTMSVEFINGKKDSSSPAIKSFKKAYFAGIASRPSCYCCSFKTIERVSDFTLLDCWHVHKFTDGWDDDLGTTTILVHSQRGMKILQLLESRVRMQRVDTDSILAMDGKLMINSDNENALRSEFFKDMNKMDYNTLVCKYLPVSAKEKIITIVKPILHKLGIMKVAKRTFIR